MKKKVSILLMAVLMLLAFSCLAPACLSPDINNVPGQVTETETVETSRSSEPEPTAPDNTPEPVPTEPNTDSSDPASRETLPESLSAQAIETDCARYRASVQQAGRYVSSYAPNMIDKEDDSIRKAMSDDLFGETVWDISALEYTLRLSNSISAIIENAADWYAPGAVLKTVWGGEASSWTAKGSLPYSKAAVIDQAIDNSFNSAIRISEPNASFNAHSYAWSGGRTDGGWLEDPLPLMLDASVTVAASPQPGDVIVYLAHSENGGDIPVHSALVREQLGETIIVESKLGQCGIYRHALNDVPNEYYYSERTDGDGGASAGVIRYLIFRAPGMSADPAEVVYPDWFGSFADASDGSAVLPESFVSGVKSAKPRHLLGTVKNDEQRLLSSLTDTMPAEALSAEELKELEDWMEKHYPACFMEENASSAYNGHSYAWSGGKKDHGWLESPASLWERDRVGLAEDVQPGDIIVYVQCGDDGMWRALHSAIVREAADETVLVESKFGNGGLYLHELTDVPGDWTQPVKVFDNGHYLTWNEVHYVAFRLT